MTAIFRIFSYNSENGVQKGLTPLHCPTGCAKIVVRKQRRCYYGQRDIKKFK